MKKKKLLAVLLSLCMTISLLPVTALATGDGTEPQDGSADGTTVAQVGDTDTSYTTLQSAIDAANGQTVKLLADVDENVSISAGTTVTIDLNGFTIDGQTTSGKAALTNNGGTVTITDTSEAKNGTIKRSDTSKTTAYYTILNDSGTMTIEAGKVENNSGQEPPAWSGSSLICNGQNNEATLILNGGTFSQDNFIAVKNDEKGTLVVNEGATIISKTQAVQNWCDATINGGTLEGDVTSWTYDSTSATTRILGGTITGDIQAVKYSEQATNKPVVEISGGTITGSIIVGHQTDLTGLTFIADPDDAVVRITGGTFSTQPSTGFIPTGYEATENENTNTWTVGLKASSGMEVDGATNGSSSAATVGGSLAGDESDTGVINNNGTLEITATTGESGNVSSDVTETAVTIASASLTSVSEAENITKVELKTDVGTLTFDKTAWNTITSNATEDGTTAPVTVTVEEVSTADTPSAWKVTAKAGEQDVFSGNTAGAITISVSYTATDSANVKVYCIDNGMEEMESSLKDNVLTWRTTHLSTFAAFDASQEASWVVTGGTTTGNGTLAEALAAVDEEGGTITLNKDAGLTTAYTIKGKVAIIGVENATITSNASYAFTVLNGGSLALNDLTLKVSETTYGLDIQYGGTLALDNASIELSDLSNATISSKPGDVATPGKFILENGSSITATDIGGNFSNGGDWTITDSSVTITNCESHGFSCNSMTLDNANVSVTGAQLLGVTAKEMNLTNGSQITVEQCGTGLPKESQWATDNKSYKSPVEIKKDGTVTIDSDSTLVLQNNAKNNNTIYLVESTLENNGTIQGTLNSKAPDDSFTVTVKNGDDVLAVANVKSGDSYPLPTLNNVGYNTFLGWRDASGKFYEGGAEVTITKATTFTAQWAYLPPANPNYQISIGTFANGTVTASPASAKAGDTVTLTATPDEGYLVGSVTVTDRFGDTVRLTENADGTYTFTMPDGQVTVSATFVEAPVTHHPFTDVADSEWYADAVQYVYENGLMDGVGGNLFAPNNSTTRAQVVTILYRLAGEPAVSGSTNFTDVADGQWYSDAIAWAAANDIVNGTTETTFAPGDEITRQQLAAILYRYADAQGYDVSAQGDLSGFPDASSIQDYAQTPMAWAVAQELVQGFDDNTVRPGGDASRAQIAMILMRFCETIVK